MAKGVKWSTIIFSYFFSVQYGKHVFSFVLLIFKLIYRDFSMVPMLDCVHPSHPDVDFFGFCSVSTGV